MSTKEIKRKYNEDHIPPTKKFKENISVMNENKNFLPLSKLPDEILLKIFQYLPTCDITKNISLGTILKLH